MSIVNVSHTTTKDARLMGVPAERQGVCETPERPADGLFASALQANERISYMKTCSKCRKTQPTTEFHKHSTNLDGLQSHCKSCRKAAASDWYLSNKCLSRHRRKKWRAKNPDKVNEMARKWRASNPEKHRSSVAKWNSANPEKAREKVRLTSHTRRARKRAIGGRLSPGIADRLFKLQRGKCACCGNPLGNDYHLDHIMPLALGGSNTDNNMQLLASYCNLQKHAKHPVDFMQSRGFLL